MEVAVSSGAGHCGTRIASEISKFLFVLFVTKRITVKQGSTNFPKM